MKIYFSGGIFMVVGMLRANDVENGIECVGERVKKMCMGYESISADKIFKDGNVKYCMPKDKNNPKTSVQKFFCDLEDAVKTMEKKYNSLKNTDMKEDEKAEELKKVWKKELEKCQKVVKCASNKSKIKDKRVQKAIEKLENITFVKNNESKDNNKLNNKSVSKYNLKKRLIERNRKIKDIIDSINEYIKRIEKYYRLESYSKENIYVLKNMYEHCFSKYINNKTTSGKYFGGRRKDLRELDFDIYEKLGGTKHIGTINNKNNTKDDNLNNNTRESAYTEASGIFKERFSGCIPIPGKDIKIDSKPSVLNNKRVIRALEELQKAPDRCKDLTIIKRKFNKIQGA